MQITEHMKTAWKYLRAAGITEAGAAGMIGNMVAESGVIPNRVEVLLLNRLGNKYNDQTYTAAVDSGKISRAEFLNPLPGKQYGYGLCQWTSPGRKAGLYDMCKKKGVSIGDMATQLGWLIYELTTSYRAVWNVLITTKDVRAASDTVLLKFEIPADTGSGIKNRRYGYSKEIYDALHEGTEAEEMSVVEKYVSFMEKIAADQSHGYSQASRWGNPDYDCSSLAITALEQAGIPAKTAGATYTGNLAGVLQKLGFNDVKGSVSLITGSGMVRGDILMYHKSGNIGHVAVYAGNGKIVHARGKSYGSAAPGDQGTEIAVTAYNNPGWQYCFRYKGAVQQAEQKEESKYMFSVGEVREGSTGQQAKLMQKLLRGSGFRGADGMELAIDGDIGRNSIYALKNYQSANKLTADGICGTATWSKLIGL